MLRLLVSQKVKRFEKRKQGLSKEEMSFISQQDILWGIEYFFYPEKQKNQMLSIYEQKYPNSYKSCVSLYKKLNFKNQNNTYKSALTIKKHIIKFGKRKGIAKFNVFWEPLVFSCRSH